MTSNLGLMRLHVEALFVHDPVGDLVRLNEPSRAPAPRFFLGITADGAVLRFRDDVDQQTRRELAAVSERNAQIRSFESPIGPAPYEAILARRAPVTNISSGPAFCIPPELSAASAAIEITEANATLLQPCLPDWIVDVQLSRPMFAVAIDGQAVAVCCSVRRTSDAHEAGVETVPAYRGRGYAGQSVIAWARAVRDMNRVPLYSTSWENERSRAVARKLGLMLFGADLHIT
jgi:hypothetical protein